MPRKSRKKERDVRDFFNMSGGAMNYTRPSSAPSGRRTARDVITKAAPLHLDLNNYEDPQFEDSKYVLTSPRSLESCSRLAFKPAELLYRPLIDFQEDLVPEGYSIRMIYEIYDQHEKERLNKLSLCKEERLRVIEEDKRSGQYYMSPIVASNFLETTSLSGKSSTRVTLPQGELNSAVDEGSLQRARTAWATNVGHERITQKELSRRADEIHKTSQRTEPTSHKHNKGKTSMAISGKGKHILKAKATLRKKQEAEDKSKRVSPQKEGSSSKEKSTPVRPSSARPWIKDPGNEATPIRDPGLREKLSAVKATSQVSPKKRGGVDVNRSSTPLVRPHDQKILQILMAKKEEEKSLGEDKTRLRRESDRRRNSGMNQRRRSITDEAVKVKEEKMRDRRSSDGQTEDDISEEVSSRLDAAKQRQLELRRQRVQEKRQREVERRKSVEERLEQQRREAVENNQRLQEKQHSQLQRASSMRSTREQQKTLQARLRNSQALSRQQQKMNEIKRKSCEDLHTLRMSVDDKLAAAEQKHQQLLQLKESQFKTRGRELEKKINVSRKKQVDLEDEMAAWKEQVEQYRHLQEKRAEELAKEATDQKKLRAMEDRIHKEKLHRENLEKLLSEEDEWRASVEANIAMKDARSRTIQQEKEEMIQESRALSQNSQRLREELKQHYSMNDLDKLNKQAALEARYTFRELSTPIHHTDSQLSLY